MNMNHRHDSRVGSPAGMRDNSMIIRSNTPQAVASYNVKGTKKNKVIDDFQDKTIIIKTMKEMKKPPKGTS